jgi:hypothetical protein
MAIRFEPKPVEEHKAEPKQSDQRKPPAVSTEKAAETAELPFDKPVKTSRGKPKR